MCQQDINPVPSHNLKADFLRPLLHLLLCILIFAKSVSLTSTQSQDPNAIADIDSVVNIDAAFRRLFLILGIMISMNI